MENPSMPRRTFLKSATAVGSLAGASLAGSSEAVSRGLYTGKDTDADPADNEHPKLSLIARYSPETVRFAAAAGYEGVVLRIDADTPEVNLSDSQIESISKTARD